MDLIEEVNQAIEVLIVIEFNFDLSLLTLPFDLNLGTEISGKLF